MIDEILDDDGNVKDNASEQLSEIRMQSYIKKEAN